MESSDFKETLKKLAKPEVKVVRVEPKITAFNDKKVEKIEKADEVNPKNLPKKEDAQGVGDNVENVVDQGKMVEQTVVLATNAPQVEGEVAKAIDVDKSYIMQAPKVESVVVNEANLFAGSNLHVKEDPTQRENLFQARCMIQEKTCKLVVDGGSCANVISQDFVKKMNLQVIPHPKPYSLRWLNSPDVLHIHKQAQVSIAIRDYVDTITCDVAPMDCAQVLLGRPWQYDRRVIYDGYQNTYKIQKDGQIFILLPMTFDEAQQERFVHVKANCQRSLFMLPCRSSKKKKKPPQKTQEMKKIRGRIFSKKGRMIRAQQWQTQLLTNQYQDQIKDNESKSKDGKLKKDPWKLRIY